jgi:precorrin-6Y C5,15-methyltransferase (decarboxylating)
MVETETHWVNVIGMGMSPRDLTAIHLQMIGAAQVLVGGRRHLASFPESRARRVEINRDLASITAVICDEMISRRVVVLASGDPLYYGIGAYLIRNLGHHNLRIWPNVNAVAAAFARIGRPWHDAVVVSLHGRQNERHLLSVMNRSACLAVFTDHRHSPSWLGERLVRFGYGSTRLCVMERMGYDDEAVRWFTPAEAAAESFREPNLVVIETGHQSTDESAYIGIPEERIQHERGLITKSEVRAVCLSKLQLKPGMVLWDLGAGSGAVGIEASCLVGDGAVYAVEKNAGRVAQIRANCLEFGAATVVQVIEADLPAGMDELPDPDRIFIGGGGRALGSIITKAASRLKKGGVMVVNAVLLESMQNAVEAMRAQGLQTDLVQIQISRSRSMPAGDRMEALNPVWVVQGRVAA